MKLPHVNHLNIGPRLTVCFVSIVVLMLGENSILFWQFHSARVQAERLRGVSQELIAVVNLQAALLAFDDKLDNVAQSGDANRLAAESGPLRSMIVNAVKEANTSLGDLPSDVHPYATFQPTIEAIESSLPSQLDALTALANSRDWTAVRLRLANEKRPLESLVSRLVRSVSGQINEELEANVVSIGRVDRQILIVVPLAAVSTLIVAGLLGLVITRSIAEPLGHLIEGSNALSRGEFWHRVQVRGNDELAKLGHVFNHTAEKLRSLYEDIRRSQAFLAEGQRLSRTGSFSWNPETDEVTWSEELYRIFEIRPGTRATLKLPLSRVHPDDVTAFTGMAARARQTGTDFEFEHRLLMPDRSVKHLHLTAHAARDQHGRLEYIGAAQDITQRRRAEEALANARSELAAVGRATTLGVLTASIAHEVNQPLAGIINNAGTCMRMLLADPPNIEGARETTRRTIRDGNRASDVITRLRTLYSEKGVSTESMDLNDATREVASLSLSELQRNRVILRQELAEDLPLVTGDRIQLQQVILNLLRNACDAMSAVDDRPRELLLKTEVDDEEKVRLSVRDAGVGLNPQAADRLFQSFYTTKKDGMGIGLSISRSIIEAHQGRLWATANNGPGVTFSFSIPCTRIASAPSAN
jgi:signal transduction histidine kinase